MTHRALTILFLCGMVGAGSTIAAPQSRPRPRRPVLMAPASSYNAITQREMQLLLADIAKSSPQVRDRFNSDAKFRHGQIENLRGLLAFASQAEKDGLAAANRQELENIRTEVIAGNYDREIHGGKPSATPFSEITEKRVTAFWAVPTHVPEFQKYIDAKFAVLKAADPAFDPRSITEGEIKTARDNYARTQLTRADYEAAKRTRKLAKDVTDRVELNVKLQQAQFLAKAFTAANVTKLQPTQAEIAAFIAAHPELSTTEKRAAAQKILDRAKAGEDFAALADQYTEDPGNAAPNGTKNGGAYRDVPLGMMVKPFETAAMALEPGQVSPQLVESDFGYHIIKLDRKGEKDGKMTYDVRHILIGTTFPDPSNPNGRPLTLKEYASRKAAEEKEDKWVAALIKSNGINVPEDLTAAPPATKAPVKKTR